MSSSSATRSDTFVTLSDPNQKWDRYRGSKEAAGSENQPPSAVQKSAYWRQSHRKIPVAGSGRSPLLKKMRSYGNNNMRKAHKLPAHQQVDKKTGKIKVWRQTDIKFYGKGHSNNSNKW